MNSLQPNSHSGKVKKREVIGRRAGDFSSEMLVSLVRQKKYTAGSRDLGCIPSPVPFQLYDPANSCEVYRR